MMYYNTLGGSIMKVFVGDKVYVQKGDLAYFTRGVGNMSFPSSIFDKMFGEGITQPFVVNEENRFEFVEFSDCQEIEFFKKCDWIVDFNSFANMSIDEINAYLLGLQNGMDEYANRFNELPIEKRKKEYTKALLKQERTEYKIKSIMEIILYKEGSIDFDLPGYVKEDVTPKEESAFQKVIKRFRRKKKVEGK